MTDEEFKGRVLRELGAVGKVVQEIKIAVGFVRHDLREHEEHDEKLFAGVRSDIRELRQASDTGRLRAIDKAEAAQALAEQRLERNVEVKGGQGHQWKLMLASTFFSSALTALFMWLIQK